MTSDDEASRFPTWADIAASNERDPLGAVHSFSFFLGEFEGHDVTSPFFGVPYLRAVDALAEAAVHGRGSTVEKAMDLVTTPATAIVALEGPQYLASQDIGAIAAFTLDEALRVRACPELDVVFRRLGTNQHATIDEQRMAGWAALAFGRLRDVPESKTDAQATFAAVTGGASEATEALALWHRYLQRFPAELEAESATYIELLWIARAVFVQIQGNDPAGLLSWLVAELG